MQQSLRWGHFRDGNELIPCRIVDQERIALRSIEYAVDTDLAASEGQRHSLLRLDQIELGTDPGLRALPARGAVADSLENAVEAMGARPNLMLCAYSHIVRMSADEDYAHLAMFDQIRDQL